MQLFEDGIGGVRLTVRVVGRDEVVDALHELFGAGERTAPQGFVGNQREEALDLIELGAVGLDEVLDLRPASSHRGISVLKIPHRQARLMPVITGTAH